MSRDADERAPQDRNKPLVLEQFRDTDGTEWLKGDRVPLARRAVREAVLARPELFVIEHEMLPVTQADLDGWLAELDAGYRERYEQVKARRDGAEERRQQALCAELEAQGRPDSSQRDLERRYKAQEKERANREKQAREERERR